MKLLKAFGLAVVFSASAQAASVDGFIDTNEYAFDSNNSGSDYHRTRHGAVAEYNDAIGGRPWDLTYMGLEIDGSVMNFGLQGGDILDGRYGSYHLGHIGINVDDDDFLEYAITYQRGASGYNRYTGQVQQGAISLNLYEVHSWKDRDYSWRHSDYYKVESGTKIATLNANFQDGGHSTRDSVLEGSLDLSLLSLFDLQSGGDISMYLTMSCVNDEIYALSSLDPSPVPVPAAVWMMGSALLGLAGYRRRMQNKQAEAA